MWSRLCDGYLNRDYILIHQTYRIAITWHHFVEYMKNYTMWKFKVDVVHDFESSLQPDIGRGFLHVSNVFLLKLLHLSRVNELTHLSCVILQFQWWTFSPWQFFFSISVINIFTMTIFFLIWVMNIFTMINLHVFHNVITHVPLFRGGADHVYESPLGDSCLVMNIHNPFMHCATSQYVFKPRDVIMLTRAVTIIAA